MHTQKRHDFHGGEAGLPGRLCIEGRLPHESVRSLLPGQVAVCVAAMHFHLHAFNACLLACQESHAYAKHHRQNAGWSSFQCTNV